MDLHALTHLRGLPSTRRTVFHAVSAEWTAGILIALAIEAILGVLLLWQGRDSVVQGVVRVGLGILAVVAALVVASLLVGVAGLQRTELGISFTIVYYASLLWLIYAGYQRGDPFRVNTGFVFFMLGVAYLYFDIFW